MGTREESSIKFGTLEQQRHIGIDAVAVPKFPNQPATNIGMFKRTVRGSSSTLKLKVDGSSMVLTFSD